MSTFDVWVMRFDSGGDPPAERLVRAFGLDEATANAIVRDLPRMVKHGLAPRQAGEMRKVLESIGAEVECRPARPSRPVTRGKAAVFQKPEDDLLPGRVSAIDPFESKTQPGVPRISVDDQPAQPGTRRKSDVSGVVRPPSAIPPRDVGGTMRSRLLAQQRSTFIKRACASIIAGVVLAAIGLVQGNSVFLGTANLFGVGVDGLAIFFVGSGAWDLVAALRGR